MPTDDADEHALNCRLFVIGAGGHAKVVLDSVGLLFEMAEPVPVPHVIDDNPTLQGTEVLGIRVDSCVSAKPGRGDCFHVAIGSNAAREKKYREWTGRAEARTVNHPRASICTSAVIGLGSFVAAQAAIGPDTVLGDGCIVNHGAVVDHDCRLGAFCHIGPNATLAGNVRLGDRVLIGAGANVLPGISIGDDCVIGAGAVVVHDVGTHAVLTGVPAKNLTRKTP